MCAFPNCKCYKKNQVFLEYVSRVRRDGTRGLSSSLGHMEIQSKPRWDSSSIRHGRPHRLGDMSFYYPSKRIRIGFLAVGSNTLILGLEKLPYKYNNLIHEFLNLWVLTFKTIIFNIISLDN